MDSKKLEALYKEYKKIKHYADGSDGEVQTEDVDFDDPSIIRGNPNSNEAIDEASQKEFSEDADRNKEPASLEDVEKDDNESPDADTKAVQDKKFIEDFEKKEQEDKKTEKKSDEEPSKDDEDALKDDSDNSTALQRMLARLKPQSTNVDFGPAQGDIANDLKNAQAKRDQLLLSDQMQKHFNLLGAGIAKGQPLPPGYFDSSQRANNAVKSVEERIALQKNDPNSQISQGMRNFVEQKYGMKIGGNPSAADLEVMSKPLYNEAVAELKGATQMALAQKKYEQKVGTPAAQEGKGEIQTKAESTGGQARETEASKQKGRVELAQLKGTIAGQMFDLKKNEKTKGASVDFYKDWVHQTGRGQPLGIAARTSIFADKLPALVNQYENLNDVPDTLVTDANLAFANLISQGVPPANLQALLNKNNLPREPGKIWTWITADPQGANQKEMLKLLIDSSHKQKELADAQMKDAAIPLLKSYEFKGMPAEQRTEILKRFNSNEDEYQKWAGGSQFAKSAAAPKSQGKQVVKKGYNQKTNQTQFIYDDGTKEIKDGKL